jgi:hypothetical protein
MSKEPMGYDDWIRYGLERGFCGPPVCETHDGLPMTAQEEEDFYDGSDPCIPIVRLMEDKAHQQDIAKNHTPSQWRAEPFYDVK